MRRDDHINLHGIADVYHHHPTHSPSSYKVKDPNKSRLTFIFPHNQPLIRLYHHFSTWPPYSPPSGQAAFRVQTRSDPQHLHLFTTKTDDHLSQHGQLHRFFLRRLPQHPPSSWLGPAIPRFWRFDQLCKMHVLELLPLRSRQ